MDSGNSGSMQSSGGEEDYDPRATADSSFNPIFNHFSPPPPTIYDPTTNLSNFYNTPLTNPFFTPQSQTLPFHPHNFKQNQTPQPQNETTQVLPSQSQPSTRQNDQNQTRQNDQNQTTGVTRNPKKRSRASRRAPTTVLTTDTSNFRAMVQEFTGIPAPPFTQSSPFPRSRLDLFSTPSSIRSNINITQTPSSYHTLLLRPLPQKLQPPRSSSTFFDDASNNSPLIFPNSSELGFLKNQQLQPQMQNPNQSNFLQSSLSNSSIFGSKTGHDFSLGMSSQSNLKINALEEFGLSYSQVNNAQVPGLPDLISPENRNNFVPNVTNEKQNNHPATNFYNGKRTIDNVSNSATRGTSESMMEPWICSSD